MGSASHLTQMMMAILVYGTAAVIVGAGLIGALRRRGDKPQPGRQKQSMRGVMTVPLGRNSCTRCAVHSRTAFGPG